MKRKDFKYDNQEDSKICQNLSNLLLFQKIRLTKSFMINLRYKKS